MAAFSQGSTFCVSQGRGESRQCLLHEEHESNQVKESSLSMLHPSYTDFKLWMNPNRGSAWVTSYSLVRTRSSRTHPWCWRQPVPAREAPATARTTAHHLPAAAAAAIPARAPSGAHHLTDAWARGSPCKPVRATRCCTICHAASGLSLLSSRRAPPPLSLGRFFFLFSSEKLKPSEKEGLGGWRG